MQFWKAPAPIDVMVLLLNTNDSKDALFAKAFCPITLKEVPNSTDVKSVHPLHALVETDVILESNTILVILLAGRYA